MRVCLVSLKKSLACEFCESVSYRDPSKRNCKFNCSRGGDISSLSYLIVHCVIEEELDGD